MADGIVALPFPGGMLGFTKQPDGTFSMNVTMVGEPGQFARFVEVPATMDAPGSEGDMAKDSDYFYIYMNGQWLRSEMSAW